MKIRNAFVSNSSSSSFVIQKNRLNDYQLQQIRNYQEEASRLGKYDEMDFNDSQKEYNEDIKNGCSTGFPFERKDICGKFGYIDDFWVIDETFWEIRGHTNMDNFDFASFLDAIGVRKGDIEWGEW